MTQPIRHTTAVSEQDAKDWTWVLHRRCPECGFVSADVPRDGIGPRLERAAGDLAAALDRHDARDPPAPDVWSPLEYACHVRDALRVFSGRLQRMLDEPDPTFANWDQDATAVAEDYASQDPSQVRTELLDAAAALAASFRGVPDDAWDRTGGRSDGARFSVLTLGRYLVHDPVHHVWDVTGVQQT